MTSRITRMFPIAVAFGAGLALGSVLVLPGNKTPLSVALAQPQPVVNDVFENAVPNDHRQILASALTRVLVSADGRNVWAINTNSNQWDRQEIPQGIVAEPAVSLSIAALMLKGNSIREVAAYHSELGSWRSLKLNEPINGELYPTVAADCCFYQSGNWVYAFGARGAQAIEVEPDAQISLSSDTILITSAGRVSQFSSKSGQWATVKTPAN